MVEFKNVSGVVVSRNEDGNLHISLISENGKVITETDVSKVTFLLNTKKAVEGDNKIFLFDEPGVCKIEKTDRFASVLKCKKIGEEL